MTHPEWAQVTVYRMIDGQRVAFAGPPVFWLETFAATKDGFPNGMWIKRPRGQLDKCAEAAALRAAFPEELGDMPTSDEGPMIYQNGGELLGAGPTKEVSGSLGIAGCKDRMRRAVRSAPVEAIPPEPAAEPPEASGEEVPDLLADLAKVEPSQLTLWQCERAHTFAAPALQDGTVLGVCPTCGSARIRRLS